MHRRIDREADVLFETWLRGGFRHDASSFDCAERLILARKGGGPIIYRRDILWSKCVEFLIESIKANSLIALVIDSFRKRPPDVEQS